MVYFYSHVFVICGSKWMEQFGILQIILKYLVRKGIFILFEGNTTFNFP